MARIAADLSAAAIARGQLGLVTREQARRLGVSDAWIDRRIASGRWERLHPGVYALPGAPRSWARMVLAAILAAGPGAVASHGTAARLHELESSHRGRVHLTVPGNAPRRLDRVVTHRSLTLAPADLVVVDGIPATSVARTLVDLASSWSERRLGAAFDQALVTRAIRLADLGEAAARLGPAPGRPISRIRRIAASRGVELEKAGSVPESRVVRVLREAGYPVVQQHRIVVEGTTYFADAALVDAGVVAEYYGFDAHRTRSAFGSDHRRSRELLADGWIVMVFTCDDSDADIVDAVSGVAGPPRWRRGAGRRKPTVSARTIRGSRARVEASGA